MNSIKYLALVLFLILIACEDETTNPIGTQVPVDSIEKSSKRGLAFNLTDTSDFGALKSGVSWWYNWHYETSAPSGYTSDYEIVFIPMLWGGTPSTNAINELKYFMLEHSEIEYLLVMNEPNLTDQANRTPAQAASDWVIYEQVIADLADHGRIVSLVGPAVTWGTMVDYADPVVWLDAFYEAYWQLMSQEPKIDYLAFHWYDYGLADQLERLKKYGKQIWVTEMANWNPQINSYEKQIQQMFEMVAVCEASPDVFRYAWFIGRGGYPDNHFTYLLEPEPGVLNELGNYYISLPY
ncbi:MAG: hypothetical protein HOB84_04395 [Candidatus Marinimicrobia bacterium]|jgi:hypothetical protein|nr:hypothetical protein [Candidatus Neomarinimicrobiota bacterium]MBT4361645.1 hypothetical protein [Candidatus Neomarinimicrobiota bacterium]MBT4713991.1 hypothetical protein [Candidatus Neomarinimicrobiota bacterium]MBT4947053.1 hypothetical protein [Candidatus Neomarinimicrobiota bacterium]MBT5268449.1 hypothetical protein [Candidatus Neomarinimicrobiota bacterium]